MGNYIYIFRDEKWKVENQNVKYERYMNHSTYNLIRLRKH